MFRSSCIRLYVIFLFLVTFLAGQMIFASDGRAQWHDNSDNLPGSSDGEFIKKAAIVVGVTVGVLLILKTANKKKDETKKEEVKPQEEPAQDEALQDRFYDGNREQLLLQSPRLMPCLGVAPNTPSGSGSTVMVGFAYSF